MRANGSGLEGYWRRRKYQRLHGEGGRKKRTLRRRLFRIKISPALAFLRRRANAPRRFLVFLRDAYVKLMLRLANSAAVASAGGFGYYGLAAAAPVFGRPAMREYDDKTILRIYKRLLAEGKIEADGGEIVAHRQVSLASV
ncbi:uncharacterized protein LOC144714276 [Wolffia australiana]